MLSNMSTNALSVSQRQRSVWSVCSVYCTLVQCIVYDQLSWSFSSLGFTWATWAMLVFLMLVCCPPSPSGSGLPNFSPATIATVAALVTVSTALDSATIASTALGSSLDCSFSATRPKQYLARQLVCTLFSFKMFSIRVTMKSIQFDRLLPMK